MAGRVADERACNLLAGKNIQAGDWGRLPKQVGQMKGTREQQ